MTKPLQHVRAEPKYNTLYIKLVRFGGVQNL